MYIVYIIAGIAVGTIVSLLVAKKKKENPEITSKRK